LKKVFFKGVQLAALIAHDDPSYDEEEFGTDINQTIQMRFNRNMLKHYKYVPEMGDIIEYDDQYFEISSVIQNRFFGGNVNKRLETICDAVLTSDTVPELTRIKKAAIESNLYGD